MSAKLAPKDHRRMIEDYTAERPHYVTYASALEHVLRDACKISIPEVIVQSRPKNISSFAEKCVRKFGKYGLEPLKKMTDLCGARVIVHVHIRVGRRDSPAVSNGGPPGIRHGFRVLTSPTASGSASPDSRRSEPVVYLDALASPDGPISNSWIVQRTDWNGSPKTYR